VRPGTPLSSELLLRPTIQHPLLSSLLTDDHRTAMHLKIIRDQDDTPTDCLQVHGHASNEEARQLEKAIWSELDEPGGPPEGLGVIGDGDRSEPLAITQLILLFHMLAAARENRP
jgi:phosphoribulokinase